MNWVDIVIREEAASALAEYAQVSIAFRVTHILEVTAPDGGMGGFLLTELEMAEPWVKDYDACEEDRPTSWLRRFDLANWGFFSARRGDRALGWAAVAFDTPGVHMLEGRRDLAVLWDIRVAPEMRGSSVGSALFRAAEAWALARGCRQLKIETQNVNVGACRFYRRQGCVLGGLHRFAYPEEMGEVQLIWWKTISSVAVAETRPGARR